LKNRIGMKSMAISSTFVINAEAASPEPYGVKPDRHARLVLDALPG
jgi:hypothetical protein